MKRGAEGTAYDRVAYRTFPRPETHPDRLAAMARLAGLQTAPVGRCRVLEIGCGDGGNLIPLAYYLPESRFVGIDLAAAPVEAAREMAGGLGLRNVSLEARDLRDLGGDDGEFDYILAHGLYSWVPALVRDRLMAVCRERLAPRGVAMVSYNAYPGRYEVEMIREILLRHTRGIRGPRARLREARRLLGEIRHPEAEALARQGDDILFHDILAPVNEAVWFRDFAAHAARHSLEYIGDAGRVEAVAGGDAVESGQYADYLAVRRFRQSLVCRAGVALDRTAGERRLDGLLFSANPAAGAGGTGDRATDAVMQALRDTAPLPAAFEELVPYAGSVRKLRGVLRALLAGGHVLPHLYEFPCEESVSARPRASLLVRYQAERGGEVTNACHYPVTLDAVARAVVALADGRRTVEGIARRLADAEGAPGIGEIREHLPASLGWMARMGLLEG